jgi:hypothetical protein
MEILIYLILGSIFGVSVGNTNIRNKIAEELRVIITQDHSKVVKNCPMKKVKYQATYKSPKSSEKPQPTTAGGCNKCGGSVEAIDKMPGYFFCAKCNSITSTKKETAK